MSFEIILKIALPTTVVYDLISNYLQHLSSIEILSSEEKNGKRELLYRFLEVPLREKWPEDLRVIVSANEAYFCFYSGNRILQEEIFNGFVKILEDKSIAFKEIED